MRLLDYLIIVGSFFLVTHLREIDSFSLRNTASTNEDNSSQHSVEVSTTPDDRSDERGSISVQQPIVVATSTPQKSVVQVESSLPTDLKKEVVKQDVKVNKPTIQGKRLVAKQKIDDLSTEDNDEDKLKLNLTIGQVVPAKQVKPVRTVEQKIRLPIGGHLPAVPAPTSVRPTINPSRTTLATPATTIRQPIRRIVLKKTDDKDNDSLEIVGPVNASTILVSKNLSDDDISSEILKPVRRLNRTRSTVPTKAPVVPVVLKKPDDDSSEILKPVRKLNRTRSTVPTKAPGVPVDSSKILKSVRRFNRTRSTTTTPTRAPTLSKMVLKESQEIPDVSDELVRRTRGPQGIPTQAPTTSLPTARQMFSRPRSISGDNSFQVLRSVSAGPFNINTGGNQQPTGVQTQSRVSFLLSQSNERDTSEFLIPGTVEFFPIQPVFQVPPQLANTGLFRSDDPDISVEFLGQIVSNPADSLVETDDQVRSAISSSGLFVIPDHRDGIPRPSNQQSGNPVTPTQNQATPQVVAQQNPTTPVVNNQERNQNAQQQIPATINGQQVVFRQTIDRDGDISFEVINNQPRNNQNAQAGNQQRTQSVQQVPVIVNGQQILVRQTTDFDGDVSFEVIDNRPPNNQNVQQQVSAGNQQRIQNVQQVPVTVNGQQILVRQTTDFDGDVSFEVIDNRPRTNPNVQQQVPATNQQTSPNVQQQVPATNQQTSPNVQPIPVSSPQSTQNVQQQVPVNNQQRTPTVQQVPVTVNGQQILVRQTTDFDGDVSFEVIDNRPRTNQNVQQVPAGNQQRIQNVQQVPVIVNGQQILVRQTTDFDGDVSFEVIDNQPRINQNAQQQVPVANPQSTQNVQQPPVAGNGQQIVFRRTSNRDDDISLELVNNQRQNVQQVPVTVNGQQFVVQQTNEPDGDVSLEVIRNQQRVQNAQQLPAAVNGQQIVFRQTNSRDSDDISLELINNQQRNNQNVQQVPVNVNGQQVLVQRRTDRDGDVSFEVIDNQPRNIQNVQVPVASQQPTPNVQQVPVNVNGQQVLVQRTTDLDGDVSFEVIDNQPRNNQNVQVPVGNQQRTPTVQQVPVNVNGQQVLVQRTTDRDGDVSFEVVDNQPRVQQQVPVGNQQLTPNVQQVPVNVNGQQVLVQRTTDLDGDVSFEVVDNQPRNNQNVQQQVPVAVNGQQILFRQSVERDDDDLSLELLAQRRNQDAQGVTVNGQQILVRQSNDRDDDVSLELISNQRQNQNVQQVPVTVNGEQLLVRQTTDRDGDVSLELINNRPRNQDVRPVPVTVNGQQMFVQQSNDRDDISLEVVNNQQRNQNGQQVTVNGQQILVRQSNERDDDRDDDVSLELLGQQTQQVPFNGQVLLRQSNEQDDDQDDVSLELISNQPRNQDVRQVPVTVNGQQFVVRQSNERDDDLSLELLGQRPVQDAQGVTVNGGQILFRHSDEKHDSLELLGHQQSQVDVQVPVVGITSDDYDDGFSVELVGRSGARALNLSSLHAQPLVFGQSNEKDDISVEILSQNTNLRIPNQGNTQIQPNSRHSHEHDISVEVIDVQHPRASRPSTPVNLHVSRQSSEHDDVSLELIHRQTTAVNQPTNGQQFTRHSDERDNISSEDRIVFADQVGGPVGVQRSVKKAVLSNQLNNEFNIASAQFAHQQAGSGSTAIQCYLTFLPLVIAYLLFGFSV